MVSARLLSDGPVGPCDTAPVVSRDGDRTVVWLDGEQDIATVSVLTVTLKKVARADESDVTVDLSRLTFLSVATIGGLIRSRNLLQSRSRNLTLRSPSRFSRRLLDLFGLAGLVEPDDQPEQILPSPHRSISMS
jgi:anti-anti-sigma factor